MLRAVIVDDEKYICILIRNLVQWEELGIEVIGEAADGKCAYELIRNERPDIVITDIRMPGMDGLELIRKLRMEGIYSAFILISGHKHFEYAHTAIQYGVENYLLKPINQEELTNNLISIRDKLLEKTANQIQQTRLRCQLEQSTEKVHQQFMNKLVNGTDLFSGQTLEQINEEYFLNMKPGYFVVTLWKPDPKQKLDSAQMSVVIKRLEDLMNRMLPGYCEEYQVMSLTGKILCFLNYKDRNIIKKAIQELAEKAKSMLFEFCNITIGVSREQTDFLKLDPHEAFQAVQYRLALGYGRYINVEDCSLASTPLLTPEFIVSLEEALEVMDQDKVKALIEQLQNRACSCSMNPCDLIKGAKELIDILEEALEKLYPEGEHSFSREDYVNGLEDAKTRRELFDMVKLIYCREMETYSNLAQAKETRYIRMSKQYISQHYSENITLEDIADLVFMNPVYFSVLFKKEEGINFSDYLLQYRMNKAKQLLKDYNISINEVAGRVGYKDSKYFSKQFNKVVGIKPSEYRKLYL